MHNFVLSSKEQLRRDRGKDRLQPDAGKKLYSERQAQPEDPDGKEAQGKDRPKMKENLKDILTHLNPEVDQETLLSYLQGKLNATEQHEVEKQLLDSDFEAEA